MTRDLSNDVKTEIAQPVIRPRLFVEAYFNSGAIHLWSDIGSITWNGHNWLGVGKLGNISAIEESAELRATNLTLSLSAIPSDVLGIVLTEVRQGLPCTIWIALLDADGSIIDAPYQAFSGRIDACQIDEGVQDSKVSITVEDQRVDFQRVRDRRYTNSDQQQLVPGDKGFEFVPAIQNWSGKW